MQDCINWMKKHKAEIKSGLLGIAVLIVIAFVFQHMMMGYSDPYENCKFHIREINHTDGMVEIEGGGQGISNTFEVQGQLPGYVREGEWYWATFSYENDTIYEFLGRAKDPSFDFFPASLSLAICILVLFGMILYRIYTSRTDEAEEG